MYAAPMLEKRDKAVWEMRHGGIEWSNNKKTVSRGRFVMPSKSGPNVFAWGPEMVTTSNVVTKIKLSSLTGYYGMDLGVAFDGRHGMTVYAVVTKGYECGVVRTKKNASWGGSKTCNGHMRVLELESTDYTFEKVIELHLEDGSVFLGWEGGEKRKFPIPALPGVVRPYIHMSQDGSAAEILCIKNLDDTTKNAFEFAKIMRKLIETHGLAEWETEISVCIWEMVCDPYA